MSPTNVLIVDDHEMVAQALAELLGQEEGIAVVGIAKTVEDARRLTAARRPDVVLMDYRLPDGDGIVATRMVKQLRPETAVVMLTSVGGDAVLMPAIEAGCDGFVTKDRPVEEMVAAVRAAAQGESIISPALLGRLLPRIRGPKRGVGVDLTARELDVLHLLAEGQSTDAMATRLVVSAKTVRNHVQAVMTKLDAHSRLEAVAVAQREGLLQPRTS